MQLVEEKRLYLGYGLNMELERSLLMASLLMNIFLKKNLLDYSSRPTLNRTENIDKVEIFSTVSGGGLSGQAGALRHGISRALVNLDPTLRKKLKQLGFLTRDARKVERKKFGKHKARRSPQFSKR